MEENIEHRTSNIQCGKTENEDEGENENDSTKRFASIRAIRGFNPAFAWFWTKGDALN